jgi:Asp-tRNA(Asn)/Glu-tRNA(Gln) amidotransferase C subunit
MKFQRIDASHTASLAHLRFSEQELEHMQDLLDGFAQLCEVLPADADNALELEHSSESVALREDVVRASAERVCEPDYVRVPLTVEGAQ